MKRESRQSFIRAVLAQHVRHMDRHLNLIIPRLGSYRVQEEHSVRIRMSAQVLASLMVLVASPAISDRAAAHSIAPELRSIEGLLHAGPVADSGIYADPQVSVDTAWSLAMQRSTIELLRGYMSAQIIKQAHGMEDPGELDEWWVHTIDTNIMLLSRAWNLLESQNSILPQPNEPALSSTQTEIYASLLIRMSKQIDDRLALQIDRGIRDRDALAHVTRPSLPPEYPAGTDPSIIQDDNVRGTYMDALSLYNQKKTTEVRLATLISLRSEHPVRLKEYLKKIIITLTDAQIMNLKCIARDLGINQEKDSPLHSVVAELLSSHAD